MAAAARSARALVLGLAFTLGCKNEAPRVRTARPAPPRSTAAARPAAPAVRATAVAAKAVASSADTSRAVAARRAGALSPHFVPAPGRLDAVEPFIQEQMERALTTGARTLVYVGAPWCEPCQRFHAAVLRGELDDVLAGTELVEFDADEYDAALHRAGYAYELIPVIAIPDAGGRSSGRLLSGSIKGPHAVSGDLVPRLRALLEGRAVD